MVCPLRIVAVLLIELNRPLVEGPKSRSAGLILLGNTVDVLLGDNNGDVEPWKANTELVESLLAETEFCNSEVVLVVAVEVVEVDDN